MFNFPNVFKKDHTGYITRRPLNCFLREHKLDGVNSNSHRIDVINAITAFANESVSNEKIVDDWLDHALRSGKKDVYIKLLSLSEEDQQKLKSQKYLNEKLTQYLPSEECRHISKNTYDFNYMMVDYELVETIYGTRLSILQCRMVYDTKKDKEILPVICDIYIDKSIIMARIKPTTDVYEGIDEGENRRVIMQKEAQNVLVDIANKLNIIIKVDENLTYMGCKSKLYNMMQKFTKTPDEIQCMLDENDEKIFEISNVIQNDICRVPDKYKNDINMDVKNLVEKYIAISRTDKEIFTKGKNAYPIMMIATDEEESYLKQVAALKHPLQMKAVFYDNKKMVTKNKKCDGIMFAIKSTNNKEFSVKYEIKSKGCIVKFYEYIEEEDSNAAIFSFLDSEE